jgi:anti-sigma factor RsiW
MNCEEVQSRLEAYADAELSGRDMQECELHLHGCAGCSARALAALRLKQMTRLAGRKYQPSAAFRQQVRQSIREKQPRGGALRWMPSLAAVALAMILAAVSVTLWERHSAGDRAIAELVDIHVATLASQNPVDVVSTDRHTVKPWFAGRIPFTFNLPEVQNTDFTLTGGRVCYLRQQPAAELLFHLRKHQLSVFISQDGRGGLPLSPVAASFTRQGFHLESWAEAGLRYVVVGDASAADIRALSELMHNAAR